MMKMNSDNDENDESIKEKIPYEESFVHHEDVLFSMTKTLKERHS